MDEAKFSGVGSIERKERETERRAESDNPPLSALFLALLLRYSLLPNIMQEKQLELLQFLRFLQVLFYHLLFSSAVSPNTSNSSIAIQTVQT